MQAIETVWVNEHHCSIVVEHGEEWACCMNCPAQFVIRDGAYEQVTDDDESCLTARD